MSSQPYTQTLRIFQDHLLQECEPYHSNLKQLADHFNNDMQSILASLVLQVGLLLTAIQKRLFVNYCNSKGRLLGKCFTNGVWFPLASNLLLNRFQDPGIGK